MFLVHYWFSSVLRSIDKSVQKLRNKIIFLLLNFDGMFSFRLNSVKTLGNIFGESENCSCQAEVTVQPDQLYFDTSEMFDCAPGWSLYRLIVIVLWSCFQLLLRSSTEYWWPSLISSLWLQPLTPSFPTSVCISHSKWTVRIASSALSLLNLAGKLVVRNPQGWYQHWGTRQDWTAAGQMHVEMD